MRGSINVPAGGGLRGSSFGPGGPPVLPTLALPSRGVSLGCPSTGLSGAYSPRRQNFGPAEARRRRGAEDTAVPTGGSPSVARRVPRTATRSRAHWEAGRWPGTGVPEEDRRPGAVSPGPRAVRTGPGRGGGAGRASAGKAGPRRAGAAGARGPGPVDRLPRSPPGAAIAPRSARRGARSSRLLPGGTRGGLAPPSPEPLAGYPSPTAEPGTGRSPARPPLDFGY